MYYIIIIFLLYTHIYCCKSLKMFCSIGKRIRNARIRRLRMAAATVKGSTEPRNSSYQNQCNKKSFWNKCSSKLRPISLYRSKNADRTNPITTEISIGSEMLSSSVPTEAFSSAPKDKRPMSSSSSVSLRQYAVNSRPLTITEESNPPVYIRKNSKKFPRMNSR